MQDIETIIFDLLEEPNDNEDILISAYIPIEEEILRPNVYTKIKSLILDSLRSNSKASTYTDSHLEIIDYIKDTMDKVEDFHNGLAIFVRLSPSGSNNQITVKVVPLPKAPKQEVFIGEVYELDQLIWIDNYSPKTLVTVISKKGTQLYSYEDFDIELLEQLSNPYLISQPNEYREKFSPTPSDKVLHGTGGKNTQRQKDKVSRKFAEKTVEKITEQTVKQAQYKYCIVFHTSNFEEYKDMINEKITSETGLTPIFSTDKVESQEELLERTQSTIDGYRKTLVEDKIQYTKSNPGLFAQGWYEVTEASRQGKIKTLFITPKQEKEGYLLEQRGEKYIYTYPVKNSRKIPNIFPWIVRNVLKKSGTVMTIPQESALKKVPAALLRYA
jgi:hypothetical protein